MKGAASICIFSHCIEKAGREFAANSALWSILFAKSIADKTVINEPKYFSLSLWTLDGFQPD
jgi:hypothetical protein